MKKILLLLVGIGFSAIPYINIPIRINNQSPPQVVSIDINNDSVKYRVDHIIDTANKLRDTVNYYLYGIGGYTGTGKQVRQASPTLTGTATVASMVFSGTLTTNALTASQAVFTDGSKNLVSNAITGSGNVVMSTSPTINTPTISSPNISSASITSPNISSASITTATLNGTITNSGTISGGTGNFTTLQQGGVQAVTTTGTQTLTNKSISASQITTGTFGTGNYGITGDLTFGNPSSAAGTFRGVSGTIADNDTWYVGGRVGGGSNDGQLYLGTNDDGNEPIIFGTGSPAAPTQWANIQSVGVTSINGLFSSSGQVRATNSTGQGTYLELAKYNNSLPGYSGFYYPTLRTDYNNIYFAVNNSNTANFENTGSLKSLSIRNAADDNTDVFLASDGTNSYLRNTKLGIGTNSPSYTLDISLGSGSTVSKHGSNNPIYLMQQSPAIGFNSYYNAGWKFGNNSSSNYASYISFSETTGKMSFNTATTPGNTGGAVTVGSGMWLDKDSKLGIQTSTPDSTLTVSGSGRFTGNVLISGNANISGTLQQNSVNVVTTSGTQTLTNKSISAGQITSGTLNTGLTASRTVITDGSGNYAVNTETGTGSHVRATSPTITTPIITGSTSSTFDENTFTLTASSGFTTTPTTTGSYTRIGKQVSLMFDASAITGTSNASTIQVSGLPASLTPATTQQIPWPNMPCTDGGTLYSRCMFSASVNTSGVITINLIMRQGADIAGNWINSSSKTLGSQSVAIRWTTY